MLVENSYLNVAITVLFALIDTVHVLPETELHPDQLTNEYPVAGFAVRVIVVLRRKIPLENTVVPR
jgi:hypothetical protein